MSQIETQYIPLRRGGRMMRSRKLQNIKKYLETLDNNTEFTARHFLDWMSEAYGCSELPTTRQIGYIMRLLPNIGKSGHIQSGCQTSATILRKIE